MLKARFPTASAVLDGLSKVVDYSVFKHQVRLHTSLVSPPQASGTVRSIQDTLGGIQPTRNLTEFIFSVELTNVGFPIDVFNARETLGMETPEEPEESDSDKKVTIFSGVGDYSPDTGTVTATFPSDADTQNGIISNVLDNGQQMHMIWYCTDTLTGCTTVVSYGSVDLHQRPILSDAEGLGLVWDWNSRKTMQAECARSSKELVCTHKMRPLVGRRSSRRYLQILVSK
jgi:hypothetical protein